jgi:isoleucyl-tRNA synthetase
MDELREPMMDITRQINWVPSFGRERELDWLAHMDDWMISKKRYWGLALPIYECDECGGFEVIGSEAELKERAVEGWDAFEGHSPHRPWIDQVKIACASCGHTVSRIKDVGNPWLDAGIVAFSTLNYRHDRDYWERWYPADLISESFPGQFRNWFYSVIAQSTALTNRPAFLNVFAYALMRDEKGEEMHKSKGNAIWFDEAAEIAGVDVMRWLYLTVNPSQNLNFGYSVLDEVRRRFVLPLWNSYSFFVTYAKLDGFDPSTTGNGPLASRPVLDRWIISRLNQVIDTVTSALLAYEPDRASLAIERFVVEELSNWYIRRNRRRFWKSEADQDKAAAYQTLFEALTTVSRLLAPFTPFLAEAMYRNLVCSFDSSAPDSVHLTDFPTSDSGAIDEGLSKDMEAVLEIVALGRSARSEANVKIRQPLPRLLIYSRAGSFHEAVLRLQDLVLDELNVKSIEPLTELGDVVAYEVRPNLAVLGPKYGRRLNGIRGSLGSRDPAEIAQLVANGSNVELDIGDGESVSLEPGEVLVDLRKLPGFAAAEGANSTLVLDTDVTPELVLEGMARDFVRGVQEGRRNAGYQIDDRISIQFEADQEVEEAIGQHRDYVQAETLAVEIHGTSAVGASDQLEPESVEGPGGVVTGDGVFKDQIEVGQHQVRIGLQRHRR